MKKVILLCVEQEKTLTIERLQELGVLHLKEDETTGRETQKPENPALDELKTAIGILESFPAKGRIEGFVEPVVSKTISLNQEREDCQKRFGFVNENLTFFDKWGDFDPVELRRLQQENWFISLVEWPDSREFPVLENTVFMELPSAGETRKRAVVSRAPLPDEIHPIPVPDQNHAFYAAEKRSLELRLAEIQQELTQLASVLPELRKELLLLENRERIQTVQRSMNSAQPVSWLTGFVPAGNTAKVEEAALKNSWGLLISDPEASDEPPTLLRYPKFFEPVKSVFNAIAILPGYDEIDAGTVFLFFFCLFFAILIGDAGYGLLFLATTGVLRFLKPSFDRKIVGLLVLTSVSTVGWGVLTGTWFGLTNTGILEPLRIDWLGKPEHMMLLCFGIGAAHLTVAHFWNAIVLSPNPMALGQLGWIALSWSMYYLAGNLVLGLAVPTFLPWLILAGLALVVLFMTPLRLLKTEWHSHVMLPLGLVSNFVDVVSYLRLFAVGAASLAMAQAFNTMAAGFGFSNTLSGIISAIILFSGHSLNIILGAMSILVHGVRLNTLEFSSHLGVQWKGKAYQPFKLENDRF